MSERDQPDRYGPEPKQPHWCGMCRGHTGPDSPCYDGSDEPDEMRAEFMAWVQDRGCDTDGAWSAWQACWNLRNPAKLPQNPANTEGG